MIEYIEVYEWNAERGFTTNGGTLDIISIPSLGQIPQKGDVLLLTGETKPYRVLRRDLLWTGVVDGVRTWGKMWLFVKPMSPQDFGHQE